MWSQMSCPDMTKQLNSITSISMDEFAKAQKTCPDVKKLISSSSLTCSSRRLPSGLILHTKISTGKPRIIIPTKLRERNIKQFHKLHHPSVRTTKRLVSSNFVWRRLSDNVKATIDNCHQCHLVTSNLLQDSFQPQLAGSTPFTSTSLGPCLEPRIQIPPNLLQQIHQMVRSHPALLH